MRYIVYYFDHNVAGIFNKVTDESGVETSELSSTHNFFTPGEIVARIIEVENLDQVKFKIDSGKQYYNVEKYIPIKAGQGILFDENNSCFRAENYGFALVERKGNFLYLTPPLEISEKNLKAYLLVMPNDQNKLPIYSDIDKIYLENKITLRQSQNFIEEALIKINPLEKVLTKILLADGKPPVEGYNEYYIAIIDVAKKAGTIKADGSIDFKELNSVHEVHKGDKIIRRFPEVKPIDGLDVFGEKIKADVKRIDSLVVGENIVKSEEPDIYISTIDGSIVRDQRGISIQPKVVIKGDVDYNSGNIDVGGSVEVTGSVAPGFSVKAKGDILIKGNVDDAVVEAGGNITVEVGIAGKGATKVQAGNSVFAKYILNASVEANNEIRVQDSIINSKLFANDKVIVTADHGKIMGGEIIAKHEIYSNFIGSTNGTRTDIHVGRSIYIERVMEELKAEVIKLKQEVMDIIAKAKNNYGEELFKDPKKYIAILPPPKKKGCLQLLAEMTNKNKELKNLLQQSDNIKERLALDRIPVINVRGTIYPGCDVYIKHLHRKINDELKNVKFYEDQTDKTIRYTTADGPESEKKKLVIKESK